MVGVDGAIGLVVARLRAMSADDANLPAANPPNVLPMHVAHRKQKRESYKAKETLRKKMRKLLGKSMELLESQLDDQLDPNGPFGDPIPLKELVSVAELLARYG